MAFLHLHLARCTSADLRAWTGLTGPHMQHLIEQLWELAPDTGRGRPWSLPFADRTLLVVLAYRTNLTMQQIGSPFGISRAAAHRVMTRLAEPLAELIGPPPTDRRELWIVDRTLIPVHDQQRTAKSKNYRRSVNVQIVCRARDRRVVAVGDAGPGNRNDIVVSREPLQETLPDHPSLSGDGGYRGCDRICTPHRGLDSHLIKDRTYRRFRDRRAVAERAIPGSKTTRSSANAGATARRSTTPSPASPHSTTSRSTSGKRSAPGGQQAPDRIT
ncbi:transposase [Streptomyces gibsoniae]|uniref:Transposase family protein n=1 Tax=Streptomyces gibsoniae TaxID=3075529 RepID=A0ABU2U5H0_9ACTN|nr:transposase [Streptomyces sp. DSM 41699]MDT0468418.1 transposase family protein [Streptomyces sp. DSM 41699]